MTTVDLDCGLVIENEEVFRAHPYSVGHRCCSTARVSILATLPQLVSSAECGDGIVRSHDSDLLTAHGPRVSRTERRRAWRRHLPLAGRGAVRGDNWPATSTCRVRCHRRCGAPRTPARVLPCSS